MEGPVLLLAGFGTVMGEGAGGAFESSGRETGGANVALLLFYRCRVLFYWSTGGGKR